MLSFSISSSENREIVCSEPRSLRGRLKRRRRRRPHLLVEFGVRRALVNEQLDDVLVSLPRGQVERVAALVVGHVGGGLVAQQRLHHLARRTQRKAPQVRVALMNTQASTGKQSIAPLSPRGGKGGNSMRGRRSTAGSQAAAAAALPVSVEGGVVKRCVSSAVHAIHIGASPDTVKKREDFQPQSAAHGKQTQTQPRPRYTVKAVGVPEFCFDCYLTGPASKAGNSC